MNDNEFFLKISKQSDDKYTIDCEKGKNISDHIILMVFSSILDNISDLYLNGGSTWKKS